MNTNNSNKKTILYVLLTFALIGILFIIFVMQMIKIVNLGKESEYISSTDSTVVEDIVESAEKPRDVFDYMTIGKYIIDMPETSIKITGIYTDDATGNVCIDTYVENNLDTHIKFALGETTVNNGKADVKYGFTCDPNEKVNKTMVISGHNIEDLKLVTSIKLIDPYEENVLYKSDNIIIKLKDGECTIIKASELIRMGINEVEDVVTGENEDTSTLDDIINSTENTESETETSETETETENNSDNFMISYDENGNIRVDLKGFEDMEAEVITNEDVEISDYVPSEPTYTVIGDKELGTFMIPGDFKLQREDNYYKEFKSADLIKVTYNYRAETDLKQFCKDFSSKNFDTFPKSTFKETEDVSAKIWIDRVTMERHISDSLTVDRDKYIQKEVFFDTYRYKASTGTGNYAMFAFEAPNGNGIITIDMLVPYELGEYFIEFTESVMDSYTLE